MFTKVGTNVVVVAHQYVKVTIFTVPTVNGCIIRFALIKSVFPNVSPVLDMTLLSQRRYGRLGNGQEEVMSIRDKHDQVNSLRLIITVLFAMYTAVYFFAMDINFCGCRDPDLNLSATYL